MRISQLARALKITRTEITDFLSESGHTTADKGTNTKLDAELVDLVVQRFSPEVRVSMPGDKFAESVAAEQEEEGKNSEGPAPETPQDTGNTSIPDTAKDDAEDQPPNDEVEEEIEVVRAKKIKLKGITVIGKIDLPEEPGKRKQVGSKQDGPAIEEDSVENEKDRSVKKGAGLRKHRRPRNKKPERKEPTYEEKIQRKERLEAKKLKQRKKQQKEKRRQKYLASLRDKQADRQRQKPKSDTSEVPETGKTPVHKNLIRRFIAWLNGEYDAF